MRGLIGHIARRGLLKCEKGATAVEYALILAMIVLVMIVALSNVANRTIHMWDDVETKVTEA
ncbi:MAG: Flp family type IVb pilin [Pseudomonadota bacterium]|nr:Flp family type IVb pilin [Sphingobium naphthae]MEC8036576.1 Flp family type IVb pilin [Pseudomonadota bacterium]|tara:strand:+ start:1630 stop:1815 length:186 start_codon:yes stop_codon:yes gene_type:complete